VIDLIYELKKIDIINDKELEEIIWLSSVEYPDPYGVLETLGKYNSRLK
jgi:hypothetical protein